MVPCILVGPHAGAALFPLSTADVLRAESASILTWRHAVAQQTPTDQRVGPPEKGTAVAPDDTGRNVRDRNAETLTPMDQSNDPRDLELTQQIRKALVADESLSTTAQNIKIITINGKVTLRGPVESMNERSTIMKKANAIAKGRVDNQLEVKSR